MPVNFVWTHRLVIAIALCACATDVARAETASEAFAKAAEHYRAGQWQAAADAFEQWLAANPTDQRAGEVRYFYAEALVQLGHWQQAREQFALVRQPGKSDAHQQRAQFRSGEAAYMTGDDGAARDELEAFRQQYPDDPLNAYVLPYLGSIALQSGDAASAEQLYADALKRYPDGPLAAESQLGLAQARYKAGQFEQARDAYRAVLERGGPLTEQALLQLGAAENTLGNFQAAADALEQFGRQFPESDQADKGRLGQGYALYKLGRHEEAEQTLAPLAGNADVGIEAGYWAALAQAAQDKWPQAAAALEALKVEPEHHLAAAIGFLQGDALRHNGQPDAARQQFQRVLDEYADSSWADDSLLGKLRIAATSADYDECLRLSDELVRRFPDSPLSSAAQLAKGQALVALERSDEAAQVLKPLLSGETEQATRRSVEAALAVAHAKLGEFAEAQGLAAKLAGSGKDSGKDDPLAAGVTYQVAELAQAAGQQDLAKELFASVAAKDSSDEIAERARSGLAWNHFQAGRWAEAAQAFEQVLAAQPQGPLAAEAALMRGRALEHLEQFDAALAMYDEVASGHADSPRAAEALWSGGRLDEQLGHSSEAARRYALLVEKYPQFPERDAALYRYGWLLRATDPDAADRIFAQLRKEFPTSPLAADAGLRLAERAIEARRFDDAAPILSGLAEAQTTENVRWHALFLLGRLELERDDAQAAQKPLEQLLTECSDPELALPGEYLLGEAYFRRGDYERAAEQLALLAAKTPSRTDPWLAAAEVRRVQALAQLRRWPEVIAVSQGISAQVPRIRAAI